MEINQSSKLPLFYRINPVAKLLVFLLLISAGILFLISSPIKIILVFMLLILITHFASNKLSLVIRKSIRFYPMVFILTILLPFSGSGQVLWEIFSARVYSAGVEKFVYINFFFITILLYSNLLIVTTPILDLLKWMRKLKLPKKIITTLFLVNRILQVTKNDISIKINAYKSRHRKLSLVNYFSYTGKFFISVFDEMFKDNEKIFFAMASRNFKGDIVIHEKLRWNWTDIQFITSVLMILLIIRIVL